MYEVLKQMQYNTVRALLFQQPFELKTEYRKSQRLRTTN